MDTKQKPAKENPTSKTNKEETPEHELDAHHGKKLLKIFVPILAVLILIGAGAYAWFVAVYNSPENVLKRALRDLGNEGNNFSLQGRLDNGGVNTPDYDFSARIDESDNTQVNVTANILVTRPSVEVRTVEGVSYVNFSGFRTTKQLREKFSSFKESEEPEFMVSEFVDLSNLGKFQDAWLEVNDFITSVQNQGATEGEAGTRPELENFDFTISTSDIVENVNGVDADKYEITMTTEAFEWYLGELDEKLGTSALQSIYSEFAAAQDVDGTVSFEVWVGQDSKQIEQIRYDGRPFADATLNFTMTRGADPVTRPDDPTLVTNALSFGVVKEFLFNPDFESCETEDDCERIADFKGMKTAFEIFYEENGRYPTRFDMAVGGADFVRENMPGADVAVFIDPQGRFIGLNGSQYAYVSETEDGVQDCREECSKFFIVTTLDNGEEYIIFSD